MGNSGAQTSGITSVSAADTTIIAAGSSAITLKANIGIAAGTVAAGNDARFGKIGNVTVTGTPTLGQIPIASGSAAAAWGSVPGGSGSGDVVGPAGATSGHLAYFDGTTGKLIKDGGAPPAIVSPATLAPADLSTAAIGTSVKYAREDHAHKKPTPADIGAATSAQGTLAGTALQPATGMMVVTHGATAATPRPAGAAAVYWIGTVQPTNATAYDFWMDTSA